MPKTESDLVWRTNAPLAPCTTLQVGGPASALVDVASREAFLAALRRADAERLPVHILGGGSNVVISDDGLKSAVIRIHGGTIDAEPGSDEQWNVHVGAGVPWTSLVEWSVRADLAGIECLAGIPGRVGAAPIQNIGAYGQEISNVLKSIGAIELDSREYVRFTAAECGFGYRNSHFKSEWQGRYAIMDVELTLRKGAPATLRYGQLASQFSPSQLPSLKQVADTVTTIRRDKSMVVDHQDPNHRSAGSFFTNPIVTEAVANDVDRRTTEELPRWSVGNGCVKLSAAWLIDHADMKKGYGTEYVGLSTNHTLAIVNKGHATATDLTKFAAHIRQRVASKWGIVLHPEPMLMGFGQTWAELLTDLSQRSDDTCYRNV
ncbi:MAG: UDP-N-acetylmuramate dehydrogenase [Myxococcota bacterium]|nr:UDP-N-acetylmuramate dehydrogenase [Myxococcota bacterium]